ncbi:MAG TPA: quinolinate synthase NadA [Methanolinea sp.]|jgi:quinolinate synthase|nr:MAG: Quinolinate synthase A [Methanoregulaceae archaeon PtaB.Bin009]OPY39915.1 MAG: Quinolinate synthase A [Methanoregulaceae archaeon PtaU1.Bin066]HII76815.1 quinolinate synthase NadA [Methanolinea sp.]HNQ28504.1 quinolinate synthase NadA [Methanolinea sp.]
MSVKGRIISLKNQKNAIILAHNYQRPEIQDLADVVGDSLELAQKARETDSPLIVFCGVLFMAETAKIINPGKKVIIPEKDATCPLADQLSPSLILEAKERHPGAPVVLYINSTAECKAHADVICTSANAVKVVRSLPEREVIVGPDSNLAAYIQGQIPEKEIIAIPPGGHCYVHECFTYEDLESARKRGGEIICHPECRPEIQRGSDMVASTGGMVRLVGSRKGNAAWNILTEREMAYRLKTLYPGHTFHVKEDAICEDMKKTTLENLLLALEYEQYEVTLPPDIMDRARGAIERMLVIGR